MIGCPGVWRMQGTAGAILVDYACLCALTISRASERPRVGWSSVAGSYACNRYLLGSTWAR